jgi:hypothetical protein
MIGAFPLQEFDMAIGIANPRRKRIGLGIAATAVAAMLGGCATGGMGYPGQGQAYPGSQYPQQPYPGGQYGGGQYGSQPLTGTVDGIDLNARRLFLVVQSQGYGGGSGAEVSFDENTRLYYRGQLHSIQGLERGDVVTVDAVQSGGRLWARTIEVVRNVRDGQGGPAYGNMLRGNVGYVDTRARTIELAAGGNYGGQYGARPPRIRYDQRTVVEYQGRIYRPENLQRGDLVSIQARPMGNELLAERIIVERSVR